MNVPKLRFKDENKADYPEWEIGELKQFCQVNPKAENLPDEFIYIDLESVESGQLLKESLILLEDAPSRAQRLLQVNDVLFQMVRPYQQNNLFFDKVGQYVASTGYAQIRTTENPKFLYYCLHVQEFVSEVMNRCTGTSYPAINSADLETIEIAKPFIEEQQKIANFLSAVDDKITALTAQKTALTQYKQGMMQRIFAQTLRFKDDNGADYPEWDSMRLEELGEFKSGVGFSESEQGGQEGIPFFKVSDMNLSENTFHMTIANHYVTEEQIQKLKLKVIKKDAIIFAKVGAAIFLERKRIAKNFLIDNNMMAFIPKANLLFMKYLFETVQLSKFAQVGALPSYNSSDLGIIKVGLPNSYEEQTKIAQFLTELDDKINAVGAQIQSAQQWKQGLLQQMFV